MTYAKQTWHDGPSGGTPIEAAALQHLEDGLELTARATLARTSVKIADYSAAAGDLVPVDATSSNVSVTLPAAPADGTRVGVKLIAVGSGKSATVQRGGTSDVFNKAGGSTSVTLTLVNQAVTVQYDAGVWTVVSDDLPKSALDASFVAKGEVTLNVKDYGAVGDGASGPADTAAFQAALAALAAAPVTSRKKLYVPAGNYRIQTGLLVTFPGLIVYGDGPNNTTIDMIAAVTTAGFGDSRATLFNLGTWDVSLAGGIYGGSAQGFTASDLTLIDTAMNNQSHEGARTHNAIQDNGSGGIFLRNVIISGFRYGIAAVYGSDFDSFWNCQFEYCDTAVYLGPYANQFDFTSCMFLGSKESLVIAGTPQGRCANTRFIDSSYVDINFEANAATRSGVAQATTPQFEVQIDIDRCWFETNAAGTNRIPSQGNIWVNGDRATTLPRYMTITKPYVVSGTTGAPSAAAPFCQVDRADSHVTIDRPMIWGTYLRYWLKSSGGNPTMILTDPHTETGSATNILPFGGTVSTNAVQITTAQGVKSGANQVTTGQETLDRDFATVSNLSSPTGNMRLTFFTSRKTEVITQVFVPSGSTAAASLTLARVGLYTVAANGDLTLVASTPSDTTLWAAVGTGYTKALSASYEIVAGQRYALGILCVGTTTPTFNGQPLPFNVIASRSPQLAGQMGGLADLPASVPVASYGANGGRIYAELLP